MFLRRPQTFYVYANKGEQVYIKFNRDHAPGSNENSDSGQFKVALLRPTGTVAEADPDNLEYTCAGAPGTGQPNRASCEVTITAASSGVHAVEFEMYKETGADLSNIGVRWKVEAQNTAGEEIPGRVWSEEFVGYRPWPGAAKAREGENLTLWAYSGAGLVYQIDYLDLYGIDARFIANETGNEVDCKSLYGSYVPKHEDDIEGLEGLGDGSECGPLKLFFEKPAADLPVLADYPNDTDTIAELPLATEYVAPTLDSIEFVPKGPDTLAGTLKIKTTNFDGQLTVWLDTDGDGQRDREFLVVVNGDDQTTTSDQVTTNVPIDGKNAQGESIPINQAVTMGVNIERVGETHFIRQDIENSRTGIRVERITGPDAGAQTLHWNDQPMADNLGKTFTVGLSNDQTGTYNPCGDSEDGVTNPLQSPPDGANSAPGVHRWELCKDRSGQQGLQHEWGDIASIDDWTFLPVDLQEQLTIKRAGPTVDKTFVWATDDDKDGIYNVVYDVVVTNSHAAEDTYALVDSPDFDDDIVINRGQATVTAEKAPAPPKPADFVPDSSTDPDDYQWQLAESGTKIAANSKHTYRLTVDVQTSALRSASSVYTECGSATGAPDQGLYNKAKLTSGGLTDEAEACGDLELVKIDKEVGTVTQNPDSTYTVTYTVKVANHGDATQYDLVDEPGFTAPLEIVGATSTPPAAETATPWTDSISPWQIAVNQPIAIGETDEYTLSFVVDGSKVDQEGQPDYIPCGPTPSSGKGLFNSATLTYSNRTDKDEACGELSLVGFDKQFVSATDADGNQTYDVTYTVTVTNSGGNDETYTLTDTPSFDDNLTINSGTATATGDGAPSSISNYSGGAWTLAPASPPAASPVIVPAGKKHTYTLNFEVDATKLFGEFDAAYAECSDDADPTRALFNTATFTNDGTETKDSDCGEVPGVVIEKDQPQASDSDGDGIYTVSYRIRVRNVGGAATTYDLADTPEFDNNIDATGGTATSNPATTPAIPDYSGTGSWELVKDREILPNNTHTYRVEFAADATALETKGAVATRCGDNPSAGNGLFNTATLTVGITDYDDSACGDVPMLDIVKSLSDPAVANDVDKDGLVEAGDSLAYTIVVTNTGGATLTGVTVRDTIITAAKLSCVRTGTDQVFNHIAGDTLAADASATCTGEYEVKPSDVNNGQVDNTATADSNETPPEDDTEKYPLKPQLDIVKESSAAKSLGDGRYEVVSTITVTSTNAPTTYDLADVLQYGDGIKVIDVTASSVPPGANTTNSSFDGGVDSDGDGPDKGHPIIVSGEAIGQNVTHTYRVTVVAEIPPAASTGPQLECQTSGSGSNGGFANTATVTYETVTEKDDSCVEPPQPKLSISKQAAGQARFIERRNNVVEYEVTYDVVATNTSAARGMYDMVDDPQFGPGTSIVSAKATSGDVTLPSPAIWQPATGANTVVTDVVIEPNSTHKYRMVLRATVVAANLSTTRGECTGSHSTNETEFFNRADLVISGTVVDTDDACVPPTTPPPTTTTPPSSTTTTTVEQNPPPPFRQTTTTLPTPNPPVAPPTSLPATGSSIITDVLSYATVLFLSGGALLLLVRRRRQSA